MTYTKLNNNLSITQFYGGAGHVATGVIIGGTQDNGTVRYLSSPQNQNWTSKYAGDGGFCAADQTEDPYFYGEYIYLQIYRSTDNGNTAYPIWGGIPHTECEGVPCAEFIAPFILDPNNANRMLAGGRSLWRSNDVRNPVARPSWTEIKSPVLHNSNISAIAVANGNSNIVWVGYKNGFVYYTTNGTAAAPTWIQVNNGLPVRSCSRVTIGLSAVEIADPEVAVPKYVTFSGPYPSGDEPLGNVWKTTDNGQTWSDISGVVPHRLPPATVFSLVVSKSHPNTLYVGTEVGVFATSDGGISWSPGAPGVGQPANVRVDELFWMGNKLVAATHGRGMFVR